MSVSVIECEGREGRSSLCVWVGYVNVSAFLSISECFRCFSLPRVVCGLYTTTHIFPNCGQLLPQETNRFCRADHNSRIGDCILAMSAQDCITRVQLLYQ